MQKESNTARLTAGFIFFAGISATAFMVPRHLGWMLLFSYFTAFFGYFWLCRGHLSLRTIFTIGVVARVLLFLSMPSLSDDIYRFIWDGTLLQHGLSPYAGLPGHFLSQDIPELTRDLYAQLNSPEYYSVYPPLNQLFFWLGTSLGDSWLQQTNTLRVCLLLADIGSFYFLHKWIVLKRKSTNLLSWFFLNPLLILEVIGNLHFEGMVIFFLIFSLYQLEKGRAIPGGVGIGLAMATKLLPMIFLPAVLLRFWFKKGFIACLTAFLICLATFLPFFVSDTFAGMGASLGLYFQKFEFNASIYFLLREVGFWLTGYNTIATLGPLLSVLTLPGILGLAFLGKHYQWPLAKTFLFSLSLYLALATTVHPWYILPLLAFGLFSGFYYPVVWSLMIFVTYFGYQENGFELSTWWIAFEYMIVLGAFAIEITKKPYEEAS